MAVAMRHHQRFKTDFVASAPSGFEITEYDVKDWLRQQVEPNGTD